MKLRTTPVQDCLILNPVVHGDDRGFFSELFHADRYRREANLNHEWHQVNTSKSDKNVVRGLHIANFAKLITCLRGSILDVVVDCRKDSITFGKHVTQYVDAPDVQVYVPAGCAHGFMALEDQTVVVYLQSATYDPLGERSVRWDDPEISIAWPKAEEYILSDKDRRAPLFASLKE